jgi:hypothetical protein
MTETLVFVIVDYLLDNEGYGFSTQISEFVVNKYPRRYTSREVVGILRNWERYLQNAKNKGLRDKSMEWGLEEKVQKLKMGQIVETLNALEKLEPETLDEVYVVISQVWA